MSDKTSDEGDDTHHFPVVLDPGMKLLQGHYRAADYNYSKTGFLWLLLSFNQNSYWYARSGIFTKKNEKVFSSKSFVSEFLVRLKARKSNEDNVLHLICIVMVKEQVTTGQFYHILLVPTVWATEYPKHCGISRTKNIGRNVSWMSSTAFESSLQT